MKLIIVGISSFFALNVLAAQSLSTKIHNHYTSLRAIGMGNAFTAVADDYTLIYYNPAGFAKKKNNEVQVSFVGGGVGPKTLTLVDDIKKAEDASPANESDQDKAARLSPILEEYYGKTLGGRLQAMELFWIRKNWGISLLPADLTIDMTINRQVGGPAIDLNVKGDSTLAFGFGRESSKELSWGFAVKGVHRVSVEQNVSVLELAANSDVLSEDRFREGLAVDADLGLMWTPGWFVKSKKVAVKKMVKVRREIAQEKPVEKPVVAPEPVPTASTEPTFEDLTFDSKTTSQTVEVATKTETSISATTTTETATTTSETVKTEIVEVEQEVEEDVYDENYPLTLAFVVRNVVGGEFTKMKLVNKDATEAPTEMRRVIDLGSQYEFARIGGLTLRSMLDFKNILHPEISLEKSTHVGFEFDYSPSTWFKTQFRAGLNQTYYTGGVTLLLGVLNIEAATYGEEVGTKENRLENRVYAAKVGMNF